MAFCVNDTAYHPAHVPYIYIFIYISDMLCMTKELNIMIMCVTQQKQEASVQNSERAKQKTTHIINRTNKRNRYVCVGAEKDILYILFLLFAHLTGTACFGMLHKTMTITQSLLTPFLLFYFFFIVMLLVHSSIVGMYL